MISEFFNHLMGVYKIKKWQK